MDWQEWVSEIYYDPSSRHLHYFLELMSSIRKYYIHFLDSGSSFFSEDQEGVAAANSHSGRVPHWARGHALQPRESLYPPSAKPLCDWWEGPARVLDAVWWAVWAEDGLHPSRVWTGRSPPGSGSDAQHELCGSCLSTATSTRRTRPLLALWPHSARLLSQYGEHLSAANMQGQSLSKSN